MKILKLFLYLCLFLITGELLVRIDMKYDLLNNAPKKIEVKIEESKLRNEINQGKFISAPNQIRILIIGDSYIYGGGIATSDKFSKKLSLLLKKSYSLEKEILILDISRPSNNTLDNYNSYSYYEKKFNPQYVFWAYNFNDILGTIHLDTISYKIKNSLKLAPQRISHKRTGLKKYVLQFYSFSELARYLSANIQKQLKFKGIVLPVGDFYYLTKKAYLETNENWITTKKILSKVSQNCKIGHSDLILYRMPEFNLLSHPNLFSLFDKAMINYTESNDNIIYFNGIEDFRKEDGDKFMLSKYDGHPNQLAHIKIAKKIAKFIKEEEEVRTHNNGYTQ